MKIYNRVETCGFLKEKLKNKERIVVSRYSDGEVNILNGKKGIDFSCGNENSSVMREMLASSISKKGQLVCINELKEKNIIKNDRWVKVQKSLISYGQQSFYGGANWNIYDFQNGSEVLSHFFCGKTLILSCYADVINEVVSHRFKNIHSYKTLDKEASREYVNYKNDLENVINREKYKNVIFCCGPLGKVLLSEFIDKCDSNLVDLGSLINAVLDGLRGDIKLCKRWNMSWAEGKDIQMMAEQMFQKIEH